MPRLTHIDLAIASANPTLLNAQDRVALAKRLTPVVNTAVKSTLRCIQKAQKSPTETRKWALDGLPYTAHFDRIHMLACAQAAASQDSPIGLAVGNAIYRTLVNTRKKGLLFKAADKAVRKPRPTAKRVPPVLRKKTKRRA